MQRETDEVDDSIDYETIVPRDVIGFHVFNPSMGMGNGKVEAIRTIRGEPHFVCDMGDKQVDRPVENLMDDLQQFGYELCTEPWEVASPEDVGATGVDEAEIRERASESWKSLANEFGVTESDVQDIISGVN